MAIAQEDVLRGTFLTALYSDTPGHACFAYKRADAKNPHFRQDFFEWPRQRNAMLDEIASKVPGHDVYVGANLYSEPRRKKELVTRCNAIWIDLDRCDPALLDIPPGILIETSPGRHQAFYLLDYPIDGELGEDFAHRLAYKFVPNGADDGTWDRTRLVRVPFSYNYKYATYPKVEMPVFTQVSISPDYFYQLKAEYSKNGTGPPKKMPRLLPESEVDPAALSNSGKRQLDNSIFQIAYLQPAEDVDRSKEMWKIINACIKAGMDDSAILNFCWYSTVNKYAQEKRPVEHLWQEICKARRDYTKYAPRPTFRPQMPELVTKAELPKGKTFIDRYVSWASLRTDAAVEYHEACAFMVLSAILAENVRLRLSIGSIMPNLWLMILADTTLTRKSTAMDLAVDLLYDVNDDAVLATDGSVEGLMQALSTRRHKPSLFHRDEFTGLMEQMTKKDYMAGMFETFTKLYDGRSLKRVLRKEVIEVKEPIFLLMCGGIKSKMHSLVREEHVSSGFIPRFIVVSAEPNPKAFKPIQRLTEIAQAERKALVEELIDLRQTYVDAISVKIAGKTAQMSLPEIEAEISDDALELYNGYEKKFRDAALNDPIVSPVFDRMGITLLKVATLIAAQRQIPVEAGVISISADDLKLSASYIQRWGNHTLDLLEQMGLTAFEQTLQKVIRYMKADHNPLMRAELMQKLKLSAQETSAVIDTLVQRGEITTQSVSPKGLRIWLGDSAIEYDE